jgi:hypothetical protein
VCIVGNTKYTYLRGLWDEMGLWTSLIVARLALTRRLLGTLAAQRQIYEQLVCRFLLWLNLNARLWRLQGVRA